MREAGPGDRHAARDAHGRGALQVTWPDRKTLRNWAKQRGWPAPWLGFDGAFLARILEDEASFEQAVRESGIGIRVPREDYTISAERLRELDELYAERSESGRPVGWRSLVEELREIRRAVEAGVVVKVEDETLRTWGAFYEWAHGRYHALEDGSDRWIGNDSP
jgi:hypothetical protein